MHNLRLCKRRACLNLGLLRELEQSSSCPRRGACSAKLSTRATFRYRPACTNRRPAQPKAEHASVGRGARSCSAPGCRRTAPFTNRPCSCSQSEQKRALGAASVCTGRFVQAGAEQEAEHAPILGLLIVCFLLGVNAGPIKGPALFPYTSPSRFSLLL